MVNKVGYSVHGRGFIVVYNILSSPSHHYPILRLKQEASKAQDAADEATAELATSQADFEAKEENLELALRKSTLMVKQLQVW